MEVDAVFIEHLVHLTIPPVVDIDDVSDSRKEDQLFLLLLKLQKWLYDGNMCVIITIFLFQS